MKNQTLLIVGAVIVALYILFRRGGAFSPAGTTTQLNIGTSPAGVSQNTALAASFASLGASIGRALGGSNSALPGGNPAPPPTPAAQADLAAQGAGTDAYSYYVQSIANSSQEEPTFGNNSNSFTIVGTGPAPIAAPNVTPSLAPTPGVLSFLNPNGNIPPPIVSDAGTGNFSTGNSSISPVATNYGATGVSLDGAPYVPVGVGGPVVNALAPEDLFASA